MSGVLERIATAIEENTAALLNLNTTQSSPREQAAEPPKAKPAAKKKATAKKKANGKRGADKLDELQKFKRALMDIAADSGINDGMLKLKDFIQKDGLKSADEIASDDRQAFIVSTHAYFHELANPTADEPDTEALEDFEI